MLYYPMWEGVIFIRRIEEIKGLREILDTHVSNPKETDKKQIYLNALSIAREMFEAGKLEQMKYTQPDESVEAHVLHIWIHDSGDFDGPEEVKKLADLLACFDYLTFESQGKSIMIGCMIEDVYVTK